MLREIGGRRVGPGKPMFVVAEIGLNHGGSIDVARELVAAAAAAGASAIKLQTLCADRLVAPGCPAPAHISSSSMADFLRSFELDEDAHYRIAHDARRRGLTFMSTPLDLDAVDMLERVGCEAYKIASGDITNTGLLERVARTGKPVVLSTGMSNPREIAAAMGTLHAAGNRDVALLHCVSAYPVPHYGQNLRAIAELARTFDVPVGLSDHSTDPNAIVIATALGASIYEKHLMLDGRDAVDAPVSATPEMLADMIQSAESARRALGHGHKECLASEAPNLEVSRRSLYATRSLKVGDVVTADAVVALRPAVGLDPRYGRELVGRIITRDVSAGTPFLESDVESVVSRSLCHAA
ncbi:MAG: N-acetylneuraminate synthase family protein [Acidobacteriota bacterium]